MMMPDREDLEEADIPSGVDILDWSMSKIQLATATIVVLLFLVGAIELAIDIFRGLISGEITEIENVIDLVEFILILFILVESYRTIVAYVRQRNPQYVLTLVLYAGIIALVRKIIVFRPSEFAEQSESLLVAVAYSSLLITMGILIYIVDIYGSPNNSDSDSSTSEGQ